MSMKYTKPSIAVVGEAIDVIENLSSKISQVADNDTGAQAPGPDYDLDE